MVINFPCVACFCEGIKNCFLWPPFFRTVVICGALGGTGHRKEPVGVGWAREGSKPFIKDNEFGSKGRYYREVLWIPHVHDISSGLLLGSLCCLNKPAHRGCL